MYLVSLLFLVFYFHEYVVSCTLIMLDASFLCSLIITFTFFTFINKVFQDLIPIKYFIYWKIMNISPCLSDTFKILNHASLL